jgi:hypothetical protein
MEAGILKTGRAQQGVSCSAGDPMGYGRMGYGRELRILVDCRGQIQKERIAFGNRLFALVGSDGKWGDRGSGVQEEIIAECYELLLGLERKLDERIAAIVKDHPLYEHLSKIKGVGSLLAAELLAFVDISRAPTVSSLWRYAGYGVTDGKADRPVAGEKLKYNKRLKKVCYVIAVSFLRARSPYAQIYYEARERYEAERPDWPKARRHLAAMRKMIKVFLAHFWEVARLAEGLPVKRPYVFDRLGHVHEYRPEDFGWRVSDPIGDTEGGSELLRVAR